MKPAKGGKPVSEKTNPVDVRKLFGTLSVVLAVPTLVLGVYWAPVYDFVERSISMVR
jgi:NADH-quinone oxidoreductase subunit N